MARRPRDVPELATIWEVPDDLWPLIARILAELDPPKRTGRKRIDARGALNAILFRLRSGCQWNHLPKSFPTDRSVHRTFQRWVRLGVFDRLWAALVVACAELGGVNWEWQAADAAMGKARCGGSDRSQPHRPRQTWDEEEHPRRSGRWSSECRDCGRQGP